MEPAGPPNLALFLVLAYLPLQQLVSMTQVCRSLRDTVTNDVLIWLDIVVESPLNTRLTNQIVTRITSKAYGRLRTLALLNCDKITDDGLLSVVNANPLISKLYIPACTSITPEGVLRVVKTLIERSPNTLTRLKTNGIYNLKQEHLQILESHLPKSTTNKPRFYHKHNNCSFCCLDKDDRPIDVEICPRCNEVKLVFDCLREMCKCRGCYHCIPRCEGCGRCIIDEDEQGDTICNDTLCLDCWLCLPKCNLCNKPFCSRHAELFNPSGSKGFVCDVCHARSLE